MLLQSILDWPEPGLNGAFKVGRNQANAEHSGEFGTRLLLSILAPGP